MSQNLNETSEEQQEKRNKEDNQMVCEKPKINDPINALVGLLDMLKSIFR